MLYLEDVLRAYGALPAGQVKLVRHQDARFDLEELLRLRWIEEYQSYQSRPVFDGADYLISFIGAGSTHARFMGAYRNHGHGERGARPLDPSFPLHVHMPVADALWYDLRLDKRYSALAGRLVVDWGLGTRSWVQHFREKAKPVVELLPLGYVRDFPGYLEFVLRFQELEQLVLQPTANREWHRMLSAVAGVYLLVHAPTGQQYVGSAYGEQGILGRWRSYVQTKHGGNALLKELLVATPFAYEAFEFSILRTLPTTMTVGEVVAIETLYKRKLGSRAKGLNGN